MHAADVLQPLLILPYAGQILGPIAFGQYAYALAITQIGSMIVDYGFHFTARRAAAAARHDPIAIRKIMAEVTAAKLILFLGVSLVGLAATSISLAISLPIFYCLLLATLGGVVSPVWLLVALERPWRAAWAVVFARILALVAFLLLVRSPSQAYVGAAIQVSIPLVTALICLPAILAIGVDGFRALRLRAIILQLQKGWHSFASLAAMTATVLLPIPLVQHFGGFAAAGHYSAAEKLVGVARPAFRIMADLFMPRVAYLAAHDPDKGIALIGRSLWTLVAGLFLSLFLYVVGPYIVILLFGPEFAGAIRILQILCVVPFIVNIKICMADLYMFNYGFERAWTALIVAGLPAFLTISYLLSRWMDAQDAVATGFVTSEILIAAVSAGFFIVAVTKRRRSASLAKTADA